MSASTNPFDADLLRERVRLYVLVMLTIDVLAYVSDFVGPALFGVPKSPEIPLPAEIMRHAVTVVLVGGWLFTRLARPERKLLVALESGITVGLVLVYIQLGLAYVSAIEPATAPVFALVGVVLLLVVRAALVPSSVARTVVIGVSSVVCLVVMAARWLGGLHPTATDGLTFMGGAFVVATGVTSHVIYGLHRKVRDAMRLGQYELGRKLGEGGMGEVYQATHVMLRRPTAVKLLREDRAGEQAIARFEREVRQTSRLEHPNSVYIYDYGRTPDGQFYYAMEYVDGVTLEDLVELDGPVKPARTVAILRQAARALAEAHAMGLVHRDVKPANIMLCQRAQVPDTVKVLDFGLVKATANPEVDGNITQANALVGTPRFLAPEAISDPDHIASQSDVYALGAVGFYLLTGRDLFTGKTVIEVCSQHLSAAPESPSAVRGDEIDAGLEALILRCLAKQPADRPADGAALADQLDELDLSGWTVADARTWWRELPSRRAHVTDRGPSERTQLAIDVENRR